MNRSSSKRQVGARRMLLGTLLAGALASGCNTEEQPQQQAPVARQEQAQEEAARPPKVATLDATALEPLGSATRSLVRATLAQGESATEISLLGDDDAQIILRDDGLNGDAKAGDGIFSGFGIVDFDAHRQTQDRLLQLQKAGEPTTMVTFDERTVVGEEQLQPLPPEAFVQGQPIPIQLVGLANGPITEGAAANGGTVSINATSYLRSLVITAPGVLNDPTRTWDPCTGAGNPNGVWTFKHLMTEMANQPLTGIAPPTFTEQWLKHWTLNPSINGWSVPARPAITTKLLNPWPRVNNALDLTRSPFKLVAIVNRPDLANPRGGAYGGGEAGEVRFVFAAVERTSNGCSTTPFLVILEYGATPTGCRSVKSWARAWQKLSLYTPGSTTYNSLLQSLTDAVVTRNAAPRKPNGSAINQVRTNEAWLHYLWEEREFRIHFNNANPENFRIGSVPGYLMEHTTAQVPHDGHNNTALLANYISTNCAALAANNYTIPLNWPTATNNFLGAFPQMPTTNTFWNAPTLPPGCGPQARFNLSFNSCNGCHTRETYARFTHIDQNSTLSAFLAGPITVADPVFGTLRTFNEPARRIQALDSQANQTCLASAFQIIPRSH